RALRFTLFPYTTLFRSDRFFGLGVVACEKHGGRDAGEVRIAVEFGAERVEAFDHARAGRGVGDRGGERALRRRRPHRAFVPRERSEEHTSELQSRSDLV